MPDAQIPALKMSEGGAAMVKEVFPKVRSFRPDTLVILGWLAFGIGLIVHPVWLKYALLAAARVLP